MKRKTITNDLLRYFKGRGIVFPLTIELTVKDIYALNRMLSMRTITLTEYVDAAEKYESL